MERIQTLLRERELDALLVTDLVNVRWLTGFPSSNAVVVVLPDRMVLLTDFRYVAGARRGGAARSWRASATWSTTPWGCCPQTRAWASRTR